MASKLFYEDVEINMEVPPLTKETSTRLSVLWAGASGDYDPTHYDVEYAKSRALPHSIINGRLIVAFIMEMMTDWIGSRGWINKLQCELRGMHIVGENLICRGKVVGKYIKDGQQLVECEIWTEDPQGERKARGTAVVSLPCRS